MNEHVVALGFMYLKNKLVKFFNIFLNKKMIQWHILKHKRMFKYIIRDEFCQQYFEKTGNRWRDGNWLHLTKETETIPYREK